MVGVLILILLILALVTGTLWQVLRIALGVALGIFFAGVLLAVGGFYLVRRELQRRGYGRRY